MVKGRRYVPSVKITEEDMQLARGSVLQWALKIKPYYERKSTPELLEIYKGQAYMHAVMSVSKRARILSAVLSTSPRA